MLFTERPRRKTRDRSPAVRQTGISIVARSLESLPFKTADHQVEKSSQNPLGGRSRSKLAPDISETKPHSKVSNDSGGESHKGAFQVLVKDVEITKVPLREFNSSATLGEVPLTPVKKEKNITRDFEVGSFFRLLQEQDKANLPPQKEDVVQKSQKEARVNLKYFKNNTDYYII